jgi:predicted N-acetyltransferase YhbS
MISPELAAWWINELIPSHARFTSSSFGSENDSAGWYLQSLCVDPSHQGKGLSRKLMAPVMQKAALQGQAVSLVTSGEGTKNMYMHMGFEVKGQTSWNPPGGNYTCWAMYMEPDTTNHGTTSV